MNRLWANISRFSAQHKFYMVLHTALLCIVLIAALIQASSFFLQAYIDQSLYAISVLNRQQLAWSQPSPVHTLHETLAVENLVIPTNMEALGLKSGEDQRFSTSKAMNALANLKNSQLAYLDAMAAHIAEPQRNKLSASVDLNFVAAIDAIQHDIKAKQSAVLLLQLAGSFLLFCIAISTLIYAKNNLVIRIRKITSNFSDEPYTSLQEGSGHWDELGRLEELIASKSILLEGIKAEINWLRKISSERIAKLTLAHDFFCMLIKVFTEPDLTEAKLRKILARLQATLGAVNTSLLLYQHTTLALDGDPIYTQRMPTGYPDADIYKGGASLVTAVFPASDITAGIRCMSVPMISESELLGVIVVETVDSHYFEETEIQLVEITAKLLASTLSLQTREQENRRVSLLEERAAIARELHDSLAQTLSYMKIQLARLQAGDNAKKESTEIVENLRTGLAEAYRELRELLATFRVQISQRGLEAALNEAIDDFSQRSSLSISLDNRVGNVSFTANEQLHILHVIREALSNIIRHAHASHADIALKLQSNGEIMVMIEDDGTGMPENGISTHDIQGHNDDTEDGNSSANLNHFGLSIIKERAQSLGGSLDILSKRSGGTRIRLVFRPKLT